MLLALLNLYASSHGKGGRGRVTSQNLVASFSLCRLQAWHVVVATPPVEYNRRGNRRSCVTRMRRPDSLSPPSAICGSPHPPSPPYSHYCLPLCGKWQTLPGWESVKLLRVNERGGDPGARSCRTARRNVSFIHSFIPFTHSLCLLVGGCLPNLTQQFFTYRLVIFNPRKKKTWKANAAEAKKRRSAQVLLQDCLFCKKGTLLQVQEEEEEGQISSVCLWKRARPPSSVLFCQAGRRRRGKAARRSRLKWPQLAFFRSGRKCPLIECNWSKTAALDKNDWRCRSRGREVFVLHRFASLPPLTESADDKGSSKLSVCLAKGLGLQRWGRGTESTMLLNSSERQSNARYQRF